MFDIFHAFFKDKVDVVGIAFWRFNKQKRNGSVNDAKPKNLIQHQQYCPEQSRITKGNLYCNTTHRDRRTGKTENALYFPFFLNLFEKALENFPSRRI